MNNNMENLFNLVLSLVAVWTVVNVATLGVADAAPVSVMTMNGEVVGEEQNVTLPDSRQLIVKVFRGIPYAQPPVGPLRFRKPEPLSGNFTQLPFQAVNFGPACPQGAPTLGNKSEDCLFLNIYVPTGSTGNNSSFPVMVWIHGGAFLASEGKQLPGERLAGVGEVVVVTLNFRIGALGFMTTDDNQAPANNGLLDQRQALLWVANNIQAFGGNPNMITLAGTTSGGFCVTYHALYHPYIDSSQKPPRPLFHKLLLDTTPVLQNVLPTNSDEKESVVRAVLHEYTHWEDPADPLARGRGLVDLLTDLGFYVPNAILGRIHSSIQASNTSTVAYEFHQRATFIPAPFPWLQGSFHKDQDPFVMGLPEELGVNASKVNVLELVGGNQSLWNFSTEVMTYWSNFAKTGNPNTPKPVQVQWPNFNQTDNSCLQLQASNTVARRRCRPGSTSFWFDVIPGLTSALKNDTVCPDKTISSAAEAVSVHVAVLMLMTLVCVTLG